ncbi:MAG: helix-turn-helix transcriptional regulator [Bacteroidales bacterium]|mgnify:CR=1 FL=1|nr:helix-turn-helix transcriptional regulator [Bacteroidales bacterium]
MKNRLKVCRAELNITQDQLAKSIGISRQAVNAIELGKFIPSTVIALKMAALFQVPVEKIFQLEDTD